MIGSINLTEVLRTVAGSLQGPVIFLLIALMALTVFIFGTLVAEVFAERLHLKIKMPELVEELHKKDCEIETCIKKGGLLKRQKRALIELAKHPNITDLERESLAVRLIAQERAVYERRTKATDLIAKVGPMLGLMGTLIPLGPGIIALGRGDTFTLSNSLLIAFDTTIAGLVCAMIALIISSIRKTWYKNYMSILETLMECILEEEKRNA